MQNEGFLKEINFPYDKIRNIQSDMVSDIYNALQNKRNVIMHAPTGIGKTVSALAPALSHAIKNNMTVFFLTSRHTQHRIVIETLKQIKKKHNLDFETVDLIGKKHMCLQQGVELMTSGTFHEFCKDLRDKNQCNFYENAKKKNGTATTDAKLALEELRIISPCHVQEFIEKGKQKNLCPYELAILNSANAKVIVCDYYYVFSEAIREGFLLKTRKKMENSIIVVDEAHNLPNRLRELYSNKTSSLVIENAKKEAVKFGFDTVNLEFVGNALFQLAEDSAEESIITKNSFVDLIEQFKKYDQVMTELIFSGEHIRELQKASYILSLGKFLEKWLGPDKGYGRILAKTIEKKARISLSYKCLDPSIAARDVIERAYSTILMSGTLTPTKMYKDLLGFDDAFEKEYKSPVPRKNRLDLVIPKTTTRFVDRNNRQYNEIAKVCSEIAEAINGHSAMFFPSYDLMLSVHEFFRQHSSLKVFLEKSQAKKEEKDALLNRFRVTKNAVLMGISTGSFGEGIDLPGILKAVIIVGLPLQKPGAESKLLIQYYEDKYGKGMEYGYILPAITRCMQNAGRCIRSETDKGAIIFLDERYVSPSFFECFPADWNIEVEVDYLSALKGFFGK